MHDENISPQRIALFSLGNVCVYDLCRKSLFASQPKLNTELHALVEATTDATCKKYARRLQQKLLGGINHSE